MKIVDIQHKTIEVISKIKVDGKEYPLHKWNQKVAEEFLRTEDLAVLDKLKDFSLSFT